ncbi:hypothetical protein ATANTOWER_015861 [Ataeniobius toweri]|uniref:Uncharacterized protein n=1 Tax=Ataeniobius toweri TaxID=208326 RepID=A0ABU7BPZ0_9TELE|nr:hypothetical protein [Ataeniobius toweri]
MFCIIRDWDRVAGAAHSLETPRLPSPQTPPPAPPGEAQGVPRPAERHSPSSVYWAVPWASSCWFSSLFTTTDQQCVLLTAAAAPICLSISHSILPSFVNKIPR